MDDDSSVLVDRRPLTDSRSNNRSNHRVQPIVKTVLCRYEYIAAPRLPVWPRQWVGYGWKATDELNGATFEETCGLAFKNVYVPCEPVELRQCLNALMDHGPLGCVHFSSDCRGLLALLLEPAADEAGRNGIYEPRECIDALIGKAG